jgi:hypothetical protein
MAAKPLSQAATRPGSPYAGNFSVGKQVLEDRFLALEQRVENMVHQQVHAATSNIMQERASLERHTKEVAGSVAAVRELQTQQFMQMSSAMMELGTEVTERFGKLEAQFALFELQAGGQQKSADGSTATLEILEANVRSLGEGLQMQKQQLQEQRGNLFAHFTQVSIALDVLSKRTLANEATTLAGVTEQLQELCQRQKQGLESDGQGQSVSPRISPRSSERVQSLLSEGSLEWVGPEPVHGRAPSTGVTRKQSHSAFASDGERRPAVPRSGSRESCQRYPRVTGQTPRGSTPNPQSRSAEAEPCKISPTPIRKGSSLSLVPGRNGLHADSAHTRQTVSPPVEHAFPPGPCRNTPPPVLASVERASLTSNWGGTSCSSTTATRSSIGAGSPPSTTSLLWGKGTAGNQSVGRLGGPTHQGQCTKVPMLTSRSSRSFV